MKAFFYFVFLTLCGLVWFSFTLSAQHALGHCPCPPRSAANFSVHIGCTGETFGSSDWIPSAHRSGRAGRAPGSSSWRRAGGGDAPREAADPLPCLLYESGLPNATARLAASATLISLKDKLPLRRVTLSLALTQCLPFPHQGPSYGVLLLFHSFQGARSLSLQDSMLFW